MSSEQLPDYFQRIAFVYRNEDGIIKVVGNEYAKSYENNPDWEHLATLDSFRWIECLLRNSPKERNNQIKDVLQ